MISISFALLLIPALFGLALYGGIAGQALNQWRRIPSAPRGSSFQPSTAISVLIPARNERERLPACLRAVLAQHYPAQLLEVIVIDDHSSDGSAEWLRRRYQKQVKVLALAPLVKGQAVVAYKKAALTFGVREATGELVVTTDADTIAPPGWLRQIAREYERERPEAIAGPVRYRDGKGWLADVQVLDNAATLVLTGAGLSGGKLVLGNGANLAFPRQVFIDHKGYEGSLDQPSGDDLFLLQKIVRTGGRVSFLKQKAAIVDTFPQPDWRALLAQRIRWAGKPVDPRLRSLQGLVFGLYLMILSSFMVGFFYDRTFLLAGLGLWGGKAAIDYALLREGTRFLEQPEALKSFLPASFLYLPYLLVAGLAGLLRVKVKWKGRRG